MILVGDCLERMRELDECSVDAIVTDPPYGLEFMGKEWDRITYAGGNPAMKVGERPIAERDGEEWQPGSVYGSRQKNPRCRRCGKLKRGNGSCKCPAPDWDTRHAEGGFQMQGWHQAWATEALRILKPGGHLLAFGGTRTYHRLACAVEDAGFEIRDSLIWIYGSGFPKSLDVSKAIDKRGGANIGWFGPWLRRERHRRGISSNKLSEHFPSKTGNNTGCVRNWELGYNLPTPDQFNKLCEVLGLAFDRIEEAERDVVGHNERPAGWFTAQDGHDLTAPATPEAQQWQGWGTALKPSHEPIVLARKPLIGTVAQNVLEHGTGALNVDGCRVEGEPEAPGTTPPTAMDERTHGAWTRAAYEVPNGRWPPNLTLSHLPECERVGVRQVKSQNPQYRRGINEAEVNRTADFAMGPRQPNEGIGHADPDGTETIPAYNCAPGCPVAELDRQSGESLSTGGRTIKRSAGGNVGSGKASEASWSNDDPGYGDTGGASRFFKTTQPHEGEPDAGLKRRQTGVDSGQLPKRSPAVLDDGSVGSHNETGSRFHYVAKASRAERNAGLDGFEERATRGNYGDGIQDARPHTSEGYEYHATTRNSHPTVKPIDLMRWLVRLVTPPSGTVLDPFTGSGTTGIAAHLEGFDFIGIEREAEYAAIAEARLKWWSRFPPGTEVEDALGIEAVDRVHRENGQLGLL